LAAGLRRRSAATALNPYIGYDNASEIVRKAASSGRSLREVARDAGIDERRSTRRSTTARWPSRTTPRRSALDGTAARRLFAYTGRQAGAGRRFTVALLPEPLIATTRTALQRAAPIGKVVRKAPEPDARRRFTFFVSPITAVTRTCS
jgi:Fumarase C C-terminus